MSNRPWYRDGLKFSCTGCGDCCTGEPGHVWVDDSEIRTLAAVLGMAVKEFRQKFTRSVERHRSLVELPNGDCIFFDNRTRGCKVYEHRPRQCLTWPFWDSNIATPEDWAETCGVCPGSGLGPTIAASQIDAARRRIAV